MSRDASSRTPEYAYCSANPVNLVDPTGFYGFPMIRLRRELEKRCPPTSEVPACTPKQCTCEAKMIHNTVNRYIMGYTASTADCENLTQGLYDHLVGLGVFKCFTNPHHLLGVCGDRPYLWGWAGRVMYWQNAVGIRGNVAGSIHGSRERGLVIDWHTLANSGRDKGFFIESNWRRMFPMPTMAYWNYAMYEQSYAVWQEAGKPVMWRLRNWKEERTRMKILHDYFREHLGEWVNYYKNFHPEKAKRRMSERYFMTEIFRLWKYPR